MSENDKQDRIFGKCHRCGVELRIANRSKDGQLCCPCDEMLTVQCALGHHIGGLMLILDNLPLLMEGLRAQPSVVERIKANMAALYENLKEIRYQ